MNVKILVGALAISLSRGINLLGINFPSLSAMADRRKFPALILLQAMKLMPATGRGGSSPS